MLVFSLFLTGLLGIVQERTYKAYGPCWKEGIFYTVCSYCERQMTLLTFFQLAFSFVAHIYILRLRHQARIGLPQ